METGRKKQAKERSLTSWLHSIGLFKIAVLGLLTFSLLNIWFLNNVKYYTTTRNEKSNDIPNLNGVDRAFSSREKNGGKAGARHPKLWRPNHKPPRRFFAYTNGSSFYAEPSASENKDGYGDFEEIPRYPYELEDLIIMNATDAEVVTNIQQSMKYRLAALLDSDAAVEFNKDGKITSLPQYLPPQFPQHDRSILAALMNATFLGFPPSCCPLTELEGGSSIENKDADCTCRSPKNYPANGVWPKVTLVTAFYQFKSKHPSDAYKTLIKRLMQTADSIVIFLEPDSEWITLVTEHRQHAPTMIIPWSMTKMMCANTFSIDEFWQMQHEQLNPERKTHHKNVSMYLFAIWCEKIIFVEAVARLNPYNTSTFAWIDSGIIRMPMPHLWRASLVNADIANSSVVEEHAVLFNQVWDYTFNETLTYRPIRHDGKVILVGGNMFAGTVHGFSNLYSAYYDVLWSMALEGIFIGEDQSVFYRACHTYPSACHIHHNLKIRQWKAFVKKNGVLNGINQISQPFELVPIEPRPRILPVPPYKVTVNNLQNLLSLDESS